MKCMAMRHNWDLSRTPMQEYIDPLTSTGRTEVTA